MKKIACMLLALTLSITNFFVFPINARAEADGGETPIISAEAVTGAVGDEVEMDISIANNPGLIGLRLTVEFDSPLTLVSITNTGVLGTGESDDGDDTDDKEYVDPFMCDKDLDSPFIFYWESGIADENLTGNGVIAVLKFKTEGLQEGEEANVRVTVNDAYDYDLTEFTVSVEDGKVNVTEGQSVSGTVTSYINDTDDVTVGLYKDGEATAAYSATVKGKTAEYNIAGVAAGTYTMKVSKANHVTREYTVTVGDSAVEQDAKICLIGDVNGDGRLNGRDWNALRDHLNETKIIDDKYMLACADVDQNNRVNGRDWNGLRDHLNESKPLW